MVHHELYVSPAAVHYPVVARGCPMVWADPQRVRPPICGRSALECRKVHSGQLAILIRAVVTKLNSICGVSLAFQCWTGECFDLHSVQRSERRLVLNLHANDPSSLDFLRKLCHQCDIWFGITDGKDHDDTSDEQRRCYQRHPATPSAGIVGSGAGFILWHPRTILGRLARHGRPGQQVGPSDRLTCLDRVATDGLASVKILARSWQVGADVGMEAEAAQRPQNLGGCWGTLGSDRQPNRRSRLVLCFVAWSLASLTIPDKGEVAGSIPASPTRSFPSRRQP